MKKQAKVRNVQYMNWNETKPLPKGWVVIDGWVMPEDVSCFFPSGSIVSSTGSFYMTEGTGWDLYKHEYADM